MKRVVSFLSVMMVMLAVTTVTAQKADAERMNRDIAVTESVLNTLLKNEFDQRNFFFMDIEGNYTSGYGVTFTVPTGMLNVSVWGNSNDNVVVIDGMSVTGQPRWAQRQLAEAERSLEQASRTLFPEHEEEEATREAMKKKGEGKAAPKAKEPVDKKKVAEKDRFDAEVDKRYFQGTAATTTTGGGYQVYTTNRSNRVNADSISTVNNAKVIGVAKNFIADYGDMLSQLSPEERIIVTNRSNNQNQFTYYGQNNKSSLLSVEAKKSDLTDFRQGKITRDQLMDKMKVVNTVSSNKVEPDMELLASIFNRLYRSDLSKTFFTQGNVYYERLTDFGAILHMQVYSSNNMNNDPWGRIDARDTKLAMPTLGLENLTQQERDKKVKELYPQFENELKENILDYGRTLKSLGDTEQLMVNVTLTKCADCGIPATVEMAVKASVLKEYNAGKLDKSAALAKIEVKKGAAQ
jgi:hypothetical protein